ncbi:MAG: SPOR domain-containing protein [Acidocella sp.]|nr:SPOR domain-containing protein [Acidocella sp.]
MKISPGVCLISALLLAACAQTQQTAQTGQGAAPIGTNTLNVADAAIAGGDPTMALSVSQSVLATDPGNIDALEHEGDAYYALGRCPAAEAAYILALKQNPTATEAQTGVGRCLLKTDPHMAEQAFAQAVRDDPGNADALNDLGIARDLQGNFAGAVGPYQQALLANPALTAAEVNLGLSLALSGNGPEALQYLGPLATSAQATPKIREDYAAALVATGRVAEARHVLSVDLPPEQVATALDGYAALIAASQAAPPPAAPAPTVSTVTTTPVMAAAPMIAPQAPAPSKPAPVYVPDNSTAAYTGPSPIPVTASSSTPAPPPAQAVPAAPVPAKPSASVAPTGAGASVQLGALNSPVDAETAWRQISGAQPALFTGKEPQIEPVMISGKTYYRLRVGGFASEAQAARFCGAVVSAGHVCTPADF